MYFYKRGGKQILDLRGDLILTHNDDLIKGRVKSAAPGGVKNATYIVVRNMGFIRKLKATFHAMRFIFGPSKALDSDKEGL
jgi:hypothetical protein